MKQTFASLVILWALVAAPNLCRAGVLVACCHPASDRERAHVSADGCCDEGESKNLPENRECGSCAKLCDTIAKPPDGGDQPGMELPTAVVVGVVCVSVEPSMRGLASRVELPASGVDLPFPPSDVPLLI